MIIKFVCNKDTIKIVKAVTDYALNFGRKDQTIVNVG